MGGIRTIRDGMSKFIEGVAVILFVIGVISTIIGTFSRTFSFIPNVPWSAELTRFCIVASVLLVAGMGVRMGMQVSFTLLLEKLPRSFGFGLQMLNNVLIILFFVIIGVFGYSMALTNATQLSPTLKLPMLYPYLFLPLGSIFLIIEVLLLSVAQVIDYKSEKGRGM